MTSPCRSAVALTLLLLIPAACARSAAEQAAPASTAAKVKVETVAARTADVPRTLVVTGALKANQESEVAAATSGLVVRAPVERGSAVARGALLASLDVRQASLSEAEAKANLESARASQALNEADCARYQRLFDKGAITRQELDSKATACSTGQASVAAADSRARRAAETLADAVVRAPFDGVVSERYVSPGEYVQPGSKVAHLVQTDPLRVELSVPESAVEAVRKGLKVQFEVTSLPGRTFTGTVAHVSPALGSTTRTLTFEAVVKNADGALRPGMFVSARLELGTDALPTVPRGALTSDGQTTRAFVVRDGRLEERVVQPEATEGDEVPIRSGIAGGERVVARWDAKLVDGSAVE
jgi:membrane fusion protein (multidrug efflux system)